jgi:hypothetical protein
MALHTGKVPENCMNKMDRECLEELFNNQDYSTELAKERYRWHYNKVTHIIPEDRLLVYSFDMGWEPLAAFMEKEPPVADVPQINKNTMFDPIV